MAFSDFKYPAVLAELGLTLATNRSLFAAVPPTPASDLLRSTRSGFRDSLAKRTETVAPS